MVFDVTSPDSYERIDYFYTLIQTYHAFGEIPTVIVGNKIDRVNDRKVYTEEGNKLARKYNTTYIECSALNGENIDEGFQLLIRKLKSKQVVKVSSRLEIVEQEKCCCKIF
jgi:50S ribosomal subunit-associated GTPase HflX